MYTGTLLNCFIALLDFLNVRTYDSSAIGNTVLSTRAIQTSVVEQVPAPHSGQPAMA